MLSDLPTKEDWLEYRKMMVALKAVYRSHFPSANLDYDWEVYWIHHTAFSREWDAWNHANVSDLIAELGKALRTLSRIDDLPDGIRDTFFQDAFHRSENFMGEMSPVQAASALSNLHDLLIPSLRAAKARVKIGDQGKTDWEVVSLIDACRTSWWRCTDKEAPKTLNPASKFGRFVHDIFGAIEVDRNPRAAMDAWRRVQRSRDKI